MADHKMMKPHIEDRAHKLAALCDRCGVKLIRLVRHWEKVSCKCGREFIALELTRGGPMQLFQVQPICQNQST